jgi:hypothetical protein
MKEERISSRRGAEDAEDNKKKRYSNFNSSLRLRELCVMIIVIRYIGVPDGCENFSGQVERRC